MDKLHKSLQLQAEKRGSTDKIVNIVITVAVIAIAVPIVYEFVAQVDAESGAPDWFVTAFPALVGLVVMLVLFGLAKRHSNS